MKNTNLFEKKPLRIVGVCLISFMLIGTFFDYQISSVLYHPENLFGIVFASYGQVPAMLCLSIAGALLVVLAQPYSVLKKLITYVFALALSLMAIMMTALDPMIYIDEMPFWLSLIIAILLVSLVDILIVKCAKDAKREDIKKIIILLVCTMFLSMLLINMIKIPWGRPRMRMISVTPDAVFQPWWMFGSSAKEHFMALGITAEEFKSFPSGHSGNAACAMLLGVLPLLNNRLRGKETLLFLAGFIFALMVAFSRLTMGAHFLTDITVGIGVTLLIEVCFVRLLWKNNKKH